MTPYFNWIFSVNSEINLVLIESWNSPDSRSLTKFKSHMFAQRLRQKTQEENKVSLGHFEVPEKLQPPNAWSSQTLLLRRFLESSMVLIIRDAARGRSQVAGDHSRWRWPLCPKEPPGSKKTPRTTRMKMVWTFGISLQAQPAKAHLLRWAGLLDQSPTDQNQNQVPFGFCGRISTHTLNVWAGRHSSMFLLTGQMLWRIHNGSTWSSLIQPDPTGSNRINRSSSTPENGFNVWRSRFTLRFNTSFTKCGGKLELLPADVCHFGRFHLLHLGSAVVVTSAVGDAPELGLGQRSAGPLYRHPLP